MARVTHAIEAARQQAATSPLTASTGTDGVGPAMPVMPAVGPRAGIAVSIHDMAAAIST
jgi:hypothetical protein